MNKIKEFISNLPDRAKAVTASGFIIALVLSVIVIGTSVSTPNSTITSNKEIEGLEIKDIDLVYEEGVSTYTAKITNTNSNTYNLKYIEIIFKDENENETKLIGYIGEQIEPNETKEIKASIDKDVTNSVSLDYSIVK